MFPDKAKFQPFLHYFH